jgi:predicted metalloprotease with PDZ domain
MELSPISQITATQFSIPAGTQGLVIVEAEGAAALAGLKPGDVLIGLNGVAIRNMTEFFQATRNGTATSANLDLLRAGQRVAITLSAAAPAQPGATAALPAAAPAQPTRNTIAAPALQVNPIATLAPPAPARAPSTF